MTDERTGLRWLTDPPAAADEFTPDVQTGPFLPVSDDDIDIFNDILSDEVDSAFTSSLCCCDHCYDDFRKHWPDVAFREMEFQTQSMAATWLVEYSRLPGIYNPAEISTLRHCVRCPRCFALGPSYVWIYEHRFSDAEEIEQEIDELLTIGSTTPFLLLEHPFAQRVLEQIRKSIGSVAKIKVGVSVYRARLAASVSDLGRAPDALATFAPPPAAYAEEGRFNHAGSPMLYVASTPEVAAAELGQPGQAALVAELALINELAVLDLAEMDDAAEGYELMQALACSALLAAPRTGHGWLKRQYVFSRFVADCARSAGFDAIRYGSSKAALGANIVILDPPSDLSAMAHLVAVQTLTVKAPDTRN